ncbi:hypothetical protein H4S08_003320 [Coemansia sp. RSA 1365]|nr:hypothetical protein H4S08_003320 [Coemansia sp. RSA 1365]
MSQSSIKKSTWPKAQYQKWEHFEQSLESKVENKDEDLKKLETAGDMLAAPGSCVGRSVVQMRGVYPALGSLSVKRINEFLREFSSSNDVVVPTSRKVSETSISTASTSPHPTKRQKTDTVAKTPMPQPRSSVVPPSTTLQEKQANVDKALGWLSEPQHQNQQPRDTGKQHVPPGSATNVTATGSAFPRAERASVKGLTPQQKQPLPRLQKPVTPKSGGLTNPAPAPRSTPVQKPQASAQRPTPPQQGSSAQKTAQIPRPTSAQQSSPAQKATPVQRPTPTRQSPHVQRTTLAQRSTPVQQLSPSQNVATTYQGTPAQKATPVQRPSPVQQLSPAQKVIPVQRSTPTQLDPHDQRITLVQPPTPVQQLSPSLRATPVRQGTPTQKATLVQRPTSAQKTLPVQKTTPAQQGSPAQQGPYVQRTTLAQHPGSAQKILPVQKTTPAQQGSSAQNPTPARQILPLRKATPVQNSTPVQQGSSAQRTTPTQGSTPTQRLKPVQQGLSAQRTTPIQGSTPMASTMVRNGTLASKAVPASLVLPMKSVTPVPQPALAQKLTSIQATTPTGKATLEQRAVAVQKNGSAQKVVAARSAAPAVAQNIRAEAIQRATPEEIVLSSRESTPNHEYPAPHQNAATAGMTPQSAPQRQGSRTGQLSQASRAESAMQLLQHGTSSVDPPGLAQHASSCIESLSGLLAITRMLVSNGFRPPARLVPVLNLAMDESLKCVGKYPENTQQPH